MFNTQQYYTTYLANHLCNGSSRKLIAGWWYSILGITICITLVSLTMLNNNNNNNYDASSNNHVMNIFRRQQCIIAIFSSFLLCIFNIVGTMIMRKFHNSIAVGCFMGITITTCQLYILLFLLFLHYRHINNSMNHINSNNNTNSSNTKDVTLYACLSIIQSILLGTFAVILAAHRTEITSFDNNESNITGNNVTTIENNNNNNNNTTNRMMDDSNHQESLYQGPSQQQASRSSHMIRK